MTKRNWIIVSSNAGNNSGSLVNLDNVRSVIYGTDFFGGGSALSFYIFWSGVPSGKGAMTKYTYGTAAAAWAAFLKVVLAVMQNDLDIFFRAGSALIVLPSTASPATVSASGGLMQATGQGFTVNDLFYVGNVLCPSQLNSDGSVAISVPAMPAATYDLACISAAGGVLVASAAVVVS